MSSDYDASEFVDGDLSSRRPHRSGVPASPTPMSRAPTREEVDSKVAEAQQKLMELRRAQEELERERAALEETRRRQMEFQTGRQEMVQNLTRGLSLLEDAEMAARRDAEQTAKTLADMREALAKIQAVHEETWNKENFQVELTKALTALENGRMEWNAARLKFPVLSGSAPDKAGGSAGSGATGATLFDRYTFGELCRLGFALTWPLAAVLVLGIVALIWFRH